MRLGSTGGFRNETTGTRSGSYGYCGEESKLANVQTTRNARNGDWDSTGTRVGLIDSVLNRLRRLWQSPSHARAVHGTTSLVASTPPRRDPPALSYRTLRSPPFPPFLSPPSPHISPPFFFPFPHPFLLYLPIIWYVPTRPPRLRRLPHFGVCLVLWP
jgi:hypothetical protein